MVRLDDSLDLPQIPVIDCGREGPLHLARKLAGRIGSMLDSAERLYTRPLLNVIDRRSVAWLGRNSTPYAGEIREIAGLAGRPGVSALNVSYEWSCTSGARDGVLWRSLDWPFDGLGANVVVARCQGRSGPWFNVTWPGFVGALTALKPGRFAAALNQAPLRRVTGLLPVDWLVDRLKVDRTPMPPPTHVLRQAFEECEDYGAAFAFLKEAPLALPALFLLAGMGGEVAIIERQEQKAIIHQGPGAIANHWITPAWRGRPRGEKSQERRRSLLGRIEAGERAGGFDWLIPPILNRRTRLAVTLDMGRGAMEVMGLEKGSNNARPATRILLLDTAAECTNSLAMTIS